MDYPGDSLTHEELKHQAWLRSCHLIEDKRLRLIWELRHINRAEFHRQVDEKIFAALLGVVP